MTKILWLKAFKEQKEVRQIEDMHETTSIDIVMFKYDSLQLVLFDINLDNKKCQRSQ